MVKTRMLQMVVVLLLALAWAPRLWAEIEVTIDRDDCSKHLLTWGGHVARNNGRPPRSKG